jgi:adenosine deaminase CECR1
MESKTDYEIKRAEYIKSLKIDNKYTKEVLDQQVIEIETKANEKFLHMVKNTDLKEDFHSNAMNYFKEAQESKLFQVIDKMPKGGLLHHHFTIHPEYKYLASIALEEDNAYINMIEGTIRLFPSPSDVPENFIKIKNNSDHKFNEETLKPYFTYSEEDSKKVDYWMHFGRKIYNGLELVINTKYFKQYCLKLFNDCLDEGILIYQGRHLPNFVSEYGSVGKFISLDEEIKIILEAYEEIKKRNSLFTLNIIIVGFRFSPLDVISQILNQTLNLKLKSEEYDNLIIGFDLVGDELLSESKVFAPLLSEFKDKVQRDHPKLNFNYYLHAGEEVSMSNDNLVDCILLKTPRIGHGLNLVNHLYLLDDFKKLDICIECNPLSNLLLNRTQDLRFHPIKMFLDYGLKVCINSDDDGVFGTGSLLNFDFFICAFSSKFDLFDFKQVILNSINHSGMSKEKIDEIKEDVLKSWKSFITVLSEEKI